MRYIKKSTYRAKRCIVYTTSFAPSTLLACATLSPLGDAVTFVQTARTTPYQTAKSSTIFSMQQITAALSTRDIVDAARNTRRNSRRSCTGRRKLLSSVTTRAFSRHTSGLASGRSACVFAWIDITQMSMTVPAEPRWHTLPYP